MIEVTGGTAKQKEYITSMVEFVWAILMPRKRNLNVHVKLTTLKNAYGYCLAETYNDFEIEIHSKLRLRRLLETVAHEMVHVKQYTRKELMHDHVWHGKTYNPEKVDYWDLPWEIEAHGREVGLFVRWAELNGHANKNWAYDK
jgi:hypothetical protein